MQITVHIGWRQVVAVAAAAAVGLLVWWASPAQSQTAAPEPLATFAFVARADNPVDALAAGAVAGQLGAPVYLTGSASLDDQARQGLADTDPQVVVLAGGVQALSPAVEQQIAALLPDAQLRRFAGAGRTETARLVNELPAQLGVDRPVLAGATVAGDVGIDGTLTVADVGADVGAALAALSARIDTLETSLAAADSRIGALQAMLAAASSRIGPLETDLAAADSRIAMLETDLAAADGRVGALQATLAGVTRDGDTLRLSGMNLQLVNGQGSTETSDGLGNLIIGYNAQRLTPAARTGSHYLIVGDGHEWTASGGIVAGYRNTASGDYASVFGGEGNIASGLIASVSGGDDNTASGPYASVSGGRMNLASGDYASVSGGLANAASSDFASVSGGFSNIASGEAASVSGGTENTASIGSASVSGGFRNTAAGGDSSVAGGKDGTVSDTYDSRIGNSDFPDS
jgi:uncharacterized coiled-coil protein SlyX